MTAPSVSAALAALLVAAAVGSAPSPAPPANVRGGDGLGRAAPAPAPAAIVIATARGESTIPVSRELGHPTLAAPALGQVLPLSYGLIGGWGEVAFAGQPFRFLLGAPLFVHGGRLTPLAGGAYVTRDTLFLPLQWLAEYIPRVFREGYRYDPLAGRFEEVRVQTVVTRTSPPVRAPSPPAASGGAASELARRHGFRTHHKVVLDPGHGGPDPGNPGLHFPAGVREKDVTLDVALKVRRELERRGIEVLMTRSSDTLINLADRAPMCRADCDLFASIHVNSLPYRAGYDEVSGIETYFLGQALTADAQRVAAMENEALRYETASNAGTDDALSFIFKDLHANEYLRESALLASAVQRAAARTHPGGDRGVHQNEFLVLATARRPAVLIEIGFATNRRDARYLFSPAGQAELADAIADGITAYLRQYENRILTGATP